MHTHPPAQCKKGAYCPFPSSHSPFHTSTQ
ncbi:hypothetical protein E2C01_053080 [Portunus trituberculatus]|uniref:Uncharacterized protein n=1 Tax=Portunus trituberculatus TaxID=210409 RepID=A0A5B7GNI9_PORTR|nr:hypothetical protein [Portunus trituberculatus]